MSRINPSIVVTGYLTLEPDDREVFTATLQADVRHAKSKAASLMPLRSIFWLQA
jgi:hypothetical protein